MKMSNAVGLFVMEHLPSIIWFKDCVNHSLNVVGEKGVDLGKLETGNLPIPPGFVIPGSVFSSLLSEHAKKQIERLFAEVEEKDPEKIYNLATQLQNIIEQIEIPDELAHQIAHSYETLGNHSFVAVRSSKTHSRLPSIHSTFLNIQGDANVIHYIKKTWASLYHPKVLFALFEQLIPPTQITQAVVIQRMTQSQAAGVAYSKNPDNHNKRTIVVDAVWGLGEYFTDHETEADRYEIEKDTWEIIQQNRHAQDKELTRKLGGTQESDIPETRKFSPKLNAHQLKKLAQLAIQVQQYLFFPQQIEWSLEGDQFFILQTQQLMEKMIEPKDTLVLQIGTKRPLLYGTSAHPGLISGKVRICKTDDDYLQIQPGEIVVTPKLNLHFTDHIRKAVAIISDTTIMPRDVHSFGVPCVGNTHFGSHSFKTGQLITVYGQQGVVYDGSLTYSNEKSSTAPALHARKTHIYLSIGEPENAHSIEVSEIAGIGLLRSEYMVAEIGMHPKFALHHRKEHLYTHHLISGIKTVCQKVHPKPVYYRFLDMTSDELRKLEGGESYEPQEKNPAIGYRGTFRYLTDLASFNLELEAIKTLKQEGYDNLHVMLPFVRSVEEFVLMQSHLAKHGLKQSSTFQLWIMVDTPSVALDLDLYFAHGVDGVTIGSKDLKMLLLGLDPEVSHSFSTSFDHAPGFKTLIKMIVASAHKYQKPVIFCEQSLDKDLIEFLVHENVEGISVNAKQLPFVTKLLR